MSGVEECPGGIVSYWTFDDPLNPGNDDYDSNPGTLIGGTSSISGIVGEALSFDGDGDRVETYMDNGIPYGNAPRTIAAWIKTIEAKDQMIFHYGKKWVNGGRFDLRIGNVHSGCEGTHANTGGNFALTTDTWGPGSAICTIIPLDDGEWHHTAITSDGTTIYLYVDGQLGSEGVPVSATPGINTQTQYKPWIGAEPGYSPVDFDGQIDEVAVFNKALDAGEIQSMYLNGLQNKGYCETEPDSDEDGISDTDDNCPNIANEHQTDKDDDGIGDACDNCQNVLNTEQEDYDSDGVGDVCDNCPGEANNDQINTDGDDYGDACDNCLNVANDDQANNDNDALGDACDPDDDNDGVLDGDDNCPFVANSDQADFDGDGTGDACDGDDDGDGHWDENDNCPNTELGAMVDDNGCSGEQLVDIDCPCDIEPAWKNHGQYVSCVAHAADEQFEAGLISQAEKDAIVSARAKSGCGKKK